MKLFEPFKRLWRKLLGWHRDEIRLMLERRLPDRDVLLDKFHRADGEGKAVIVRTLIEALDEDELRGDASRLLVALGKDAVPELINALVDRESLRRDIAVVMAEIGEPAVDDLIELVNSTDDEMVMWAAVWALGEIGDARAYEPLMKLLGSEASLFFLRTVQEALEKIMEKNEIEYP